MPSGCDPEIILLPLTVTDTPSSGDASSAAVTMPETVRVAADWAVAPAAAHNSSIQKQ